MTGINYFRQKLERKKGQQMQLERDLTTTEIQEKNVLESIEHTKHAQSIIQIVAQKTQKDLEYRLSGLVDLALKAIFEHPYKLKIEFVLRRGKTECDIFFEKNNKIYDPLYCSGGGVIDVVAMALRVAIWSLTQSRNVLILDEPFRFLSKEYQEKASFMLKELSKKLNLQIIMVSHSDSLIEGADKVFQIKIQKGISEIVEGV